jgi:hypothetical protein
MVDRGQFPAFDPYVPERPTQVDCFLKVEAVERVAPGKSLIVIRIGLSEPQAFCSKMS